MQKKKSYILLLLVLALVCLGVVNSYSIGRSAQSSEHYKIARMAYLVSANIDNEKAQNNLAGLYAEGYGGAVDNVKAAKWFQKAADNGVSVAKFNLSNFYEEGKGVKRDTTKAANLLEELAANGDIDAQYNLGSLYSAGRSDFPKNAERAIFWYQKAAERGFASAQYNLGSIYAQGNGVPKNLSLAGDWYSKAVKQNHPKALLDLGTMYAYGLGYDVDIEKGFELLHKAKLQPQTIVEAKKRIDDICKLLSDPRIAACKK